MLAAFLLCVLFEYFSPEFLLFVSSTAIPHPSFATVVGAAHGMDVIREHLESPGRGDDKLNEVLLMPLKSNASLRVGSPVPMFPMLNNDNEPLCFFLLFLGSVTGTQTFESLSKHHSHLHEYALSVGGKRYSYDTVTSTMRGESVWKEHYGAAVWHRMCLAKREYDPFHILGAGVHIWRD